MVDDNSDQFVLKTPLTTKATNLPPYRDSEDDDNDDDDDDDDEWRRPRLATQEMINVFSHDRWRSRHAATSDRCSFFPVFFFDVMRNFERRKG